MEEDTRIDRIYYQKLVRDRIPELIRLQGDACHVEELNYSDYKRELRVKLVEEANEALTATSTADLLTEIADVYEVLYAFILAYDISPEDVKRRQEQRHIERGGFTRRLKLCWTEPC
ncbi:phosphoribosyl-ATP pyrophosphohydrolase [Ktedonobacteria bacterium brp13]|nr:phosphoribosyl-ATP pyrophosphohydrolase [Ktedonobacteria bacterium brp13]